MIIFFYNYDVSFRVLVHWRDPTLKEVIEYLDSNDKVEQLNASGYLQHLTYNDNVIKEETRLVPFEIQLSMVSECETIGTNYFIH